MYHLIKKDILVQKKPFLISILLVLFFSLYISDMKSVGLMLSVFTVTVMLTLGSSAIEEKNNSDKMLISLPIKKSTIVLSKYFSIFVYIGYVLLLNVVIYLVIDVTKLPVDTVPFSVELLLTAIIVPVLYCSITFPLIFKLGYLKARMVNFVLFFAIVFGGTWLFEKFFAGELGLEKFLLERSPMELSILALISTLLIFVLSYWLSLYFYKTREF